MPTGAAVERLTREAAVSAAALGLAREYVLVVPGKPVPWQAAVKMGSAHNAPRKMPGRQEHHAGLIRDTWQREGDPSLWLEKGRAVEVIGHFFISRPKDQYGSGRNERRLKPVDHPKYRSAPTVAPDLSNLLKMVEDALTGSVWADDDQVVSLSGKKSYVDWWEQSRSVIRIKLVAAA
jgi:hypothetical protein